MNTLNETFKNGAAIMSLIWSVGKMKVLPYFQI